MGFKISIKSEVAKMEKFLSVAPLLARQANKELAKDIANKAGEYAKEVMNAQGFPGADIPLSEEYEARKLAEGYGDKILIKKEHYINNIKSHKVDDLTYTVGVLPGTIIDGVDYHLVALFHEYGTKTTPARPLWSHVEQVTKKNIPSLFRTHYLTFFSEFIK